MGFISLVKKIKVDFLLVAGAIIVALVSFAPEFIAILRLGDGSRGMPFIFQANEDAYLARIREVTDGHGKIGSAFLYEYKDWNPMVPSVGEYMYAWPTVVFNLPLLPAYRAIKIIFPALLFVLVYTLICCLSLDSLSQSGRLNAFVGGLLVTLGYDLVDFRSIITLIKDPTYFGSLSVWIRPVNPITGAILIFAFLLLAFIITTKPRRYIFIPAALVWALTIGYVFSWTFILAFIGVLAGWAAWRKDTYVLSQLGLTTLVWALVTLPYWLTVISSLSSPEGQAVAARSGLVLTHAPVINKFLLAATLVFIVSSIYFRYVNKNQKHESENLSWWFCVLLIVTCWIVFSQQIITGHSIWHHHYVQYTIPVILVIGMVMFNNWIKTSFFKLWVAGIGTVMVLIVLYNALALHSTSHYVGVFKQLQRYQPLFTWIQANTNPDCVILNQDDPGAKFDTLIPAFTHCNVYAPSWVFDGVPPERVWHNYLVMLRLRAVDPASVKSYLEEHAEEVTSYFFTNWNQLFYAADKAFTMETIDKLAVAYQDFIKKDFSSELKKYKLDYIVFVGNPSATMLKQFSFVQEAYHDDTYWMYQISP